MKCNRCDGSGFLNYDRDLPMQVFESGNDAILRWLSVLPNTDMSVCDCCGNGENWHGVPGEHYTRDDPRGKHGPYAYNGGLAECH